MLHGGFPPVAVEVSQENVARARGRRGRVKLRLGMHEVVRLPQKSSGRAQPSTRPQRNQYLSFAPPRAGISDSTTVKRDSRPGARRRRLRGSRSASEGGRAHLAHVCDRKGDAVTVREQNFETPPRGEGDAAPPLFDERSAQT